MSVLTWVDAALQGFYIGVWLGLALVAALVFFTLKGGRRK